MRSAGSGRAPFRRAALGVAVAAACAVSGAAVAFEIDTGNPDLALRWDNTIRYNIGMRAQGQNDAILRTPTSTTATAISPRARW